MEVLNELRLDSDRTISVIKEMEIDPEIDLKVLHYKDFISPGLTPQIVQMRYLAYVHRTVETAQEILIRRDQLISGLKKDKTFRTGIYKPRRFIGYIHPSKCFHISLN